MYTTNLRIIDRKEAEQFMSKFSVRPEPPDIVSELSKLQLVLDQKLLEAETKCRLPRESRQELSKTNHRLIAARGRFV